MELGGLLPFAGFWATAALVALAVVVVLARAIHVSRGAQLAARPYDLKVYRDQLDEIERDVARGIVGAEDAERARTEVARRILAADAASDVHDELHSAPARRAPAWILVVLIGATLVGGSIAIYAQMGAPGYADLGLSTRIEQAAERRATRPGQAAAVAATQTQTPQPPVDAPEEYLALIAQLRQTVAARPDDTQGLALLVNAEARLGNFDAAAKTQAQLIAAIGEDAPADAFSAQADLMVLAAGGYVAPEAEEVLKEALARNAADGTARYYWGLMMAQTGRPDTAFRIWDVLLRAGPPEAPWIAPIEAQIMDMATRAGVNYQMPEIGGGSKGPSAEDIAAAQDMTPSERMEMIRNMVGGLSDRLATEGGPVADWAQLITSLGVIGERAQATAILREARTRFAGDKAALDTLLRAAEQANLE